MNPESPQAFVHLHIHSEYSLLDGSMRVKKLVKELVARGATAAALTDHDGMYGSLEFYLECQKEKINGIFGYEANVMAMRESLGTSHLVLLAENNLGYQNLIKLASLANTVGIDAHGKSSTSISWSQVKEHSQGLICLTGCAASEIAQLPEPAAADYLKELIGIFGSDCVYVELMDNGLPGQQETNARLVTLANACGAQVVATADVHYLKPSDKETHLSLLAIKHKMRRNELMPIPPHVSFHLATADEMLQKFAHIPEAISNTVAIANRCKVIIDTKSFFMPDFQALPGESADDGLVRLSRLGLIERRTLIESIYQDKFTPELWQEYEDRLQYELDVIIKMKFSGYFLIVQDFINWAKDRSIPVGPGRGSAAGSLVTYALRITNIDPIRFNLLFERFLNPERISMPDIDTDFCQDRRDEVIQYVYQRYGNENVSQIVTFGRLMARNAIKSLARITGWSFHESNDFAKFIPETPGVTLEQSRTEVEALQTRLNNDERAQTLFDGAVQIEGVLNSLGIHAAGVIISDSPLVNRCPMMSSEGQLLTQFENKYAEKIGLIKFDFLGLKTLTVVDKAVQLIRKRHNPQFEVENLDLEDPKVYELISTAHVTGLFQLESGGMRKLIADLKPSAFSDIVAVLALFRPGPLGSGMVDDFVLRKHGKNPVEYLFPELEPILADTYGVIVFQEQVQKIAAVLASYSLGEADLLRRAMGKKDAKEMASQKNRFLAGSANNGHPTDKAEALFDLMAKFAEYGFNKSHTAAYGWVTFQTAYLKTHYPTEFLAAIMTCDMDNTDKILTYVKDCYRMHIKLLPPCINQSEYEFSIPETQMLRFGLGAIKGLGQGVIQSILEERRANGVFASVPEFIARTDARKLNKKIMECLAKSGAFDAIHDNRAEILHNSDHWLKSIASETASQEKNGGGMFGAEDAIANLLLSVQSQPAAPWPTLERLAEEHATLGFYLTGHPADIVHDDCKEFWSASLADAVTLLEPDTIPDFRKKTVTLAGYISQVFEKRTKENEKFCVFRLEDAKNEIEIALFPKQFTALTKPIKIGEFAVVECKLKRGVEQGTVKGVCQSIVSLSQRRTERTRRIIIQAQENFLDFAKNIEQLKAVMGQNKGDVPVTLEVFCPVHRVKVKAKLGTIAPTDQFLKAIDTNWPQELKVLRIYKAEALDMQQS